jgi:hypothetical protein
MLLLSFQLNIFLKSPAVALLESFILDANAAAGQG